MNKKIRQELTTLTPEQVEHKVEELRRELFKLNLSAATSHVRSFPSDRRKLKRAIACALTHLRRK